MMVVVSSHFILILRKAITIYLNICYFGFGAGMLMVSEWSNWKRSLWLILSHTSVSMDTNVWSLLCGLQLIPHTITHAREETAYFICFRYNILLGERWQVLICLRPGHLFESPVSLFAGLCLLSLRPLAYIWKRATFNKQAWWMPDKVTI